MLHDGWPRPSAGHVGADVTADCQVASSPRDDLPLFPLARRLSDTDTVERQITIPPDPVAGRARPPGHPTWRSTLPFSPSTWIRATGALSTPSTDERLRRGLALQAVLALPRLSSTYVRARSPCPTPTSRPLPWSWPTWWLRARRCSPLSSALRLRPCATRSHVRHEYNLACLWPSSPGWSGAPDPLLPWCVASWSRQHLRLPPSPCPAEAGSPILQPCAGGGRLMPPATTTWLEATTVA